MENLVLARIDDRLIHGQVMTAWMKSRPATRIMVVDDKVARDSFMISVIEMAAPSGVKVDVLSCAKAAEALCGGLGEPTIVLAKTPETYRQLIDHGVDIREINLGGMGMSPGRRTLYKNIAASDAERALLKRMLADGVDVRIQIIPAESVIEIGKLL